MINKKVQEENNKIMFNNNYNYNYIIKNEGYFENYIYKYKDYLLNKNILEPFLLKDKYFIIYIITKMQEENITGLCDYEDYKNSIEVIKEKIEEKIKEINKKDLRTMLIIIKI
jgi:hypothetical protein